MRNVKTIQKLAVASMPLAALAVAAGFSDAYAGGAKPREAGVWIDDTGKGAVRIESCGENLCGKIVWLREPLDAQGAPLTDKNNPDPSKTSRPICGLPTLGQLAAMPEGGYDGGWVYDPKVGKAYDAAIIIIDTNRLQVTGYKGMRFLGKSFIWTRATTDLPACDAQANAAPATAPTKKTAPANKAAPANAAAGDLPWAAKAADKPKPVKKTDGAAQLGAPKPVPAQKPKPELTSE